MEENEYSEEDEEGEEETPEGEILDPGNPEHEFTIMERSFQKTLGDMEQDINAAQYAEEYANLFDKLYSYNEEKNKLRATIAELESKISETADQLEMSEKLAKTDAETIEDLKNQIQQAWRMADMAHLREQLAQEVIENLRKQIKELSGELELRNRIAQEEAEEEGSQSKQKETLLREKQKLSNEVQQLTIKLNNALSYQQELERKNSAADLKINEISGKLEDETGECERQKANKEKLENEVIDLKEMIEQRDKNVSELKGNIHAQTKQIAKLEGQIFQHKATYDKLYRESESLAHKYQKLGEELQQSQVDYEELKSQLQKKMAAIKNCEEEQQHLKNEYNKAQKAMETAEKRTKNVEIEREQAIAEGVKLKQQVFMMEREVHQMKKSEQYGKRDLENFQREKEIMSKNLLRCQAVSTDHIKLIKLQEQTRRKLEGEADEMKVEVNRQSKLISSLERERDRLAEEGIDLTNKIETMMDDIRFKKDEIYELKKGVAELESRMRMQENLFEQVRAERNGLQKSLQETIAEITELKSKLKIVNHQTEQLKEDIATKEQLLVKEENFLRKLNKEKEALIVDLNNARDTIKVMKFDISEMAAEEKRLHKVILEGERTIRQQAKDLEQLMNERDILGSQLVRRNDELALLYEKIRILQTTLHRGEAQYAQRLEDIRLLKIEIKRLRQEKQLLTRSVTNSTDLRQEIFHLDRDLTRERLKCRALEEEVCNPLNVHRWRQLEGSDPNALEMLQKIQLLQKRVLRMIAEAVERERHVKEVERMYLNLKAVVAKQPGFEIQAELLRTQKALAVRKNKMKCLVSELNMTEQQSNEYKLRLEKVQEELTDFRKKYMAEKRAEAKRREMLEMGPAAPPLPQSSTSLKSVGGGFRMSTST